MIARTVSHGDAEYLRLVEVSPNARLQHTSQYLNHLERLGGQRVVVLGVWQDGQLEAAIPLCMRDGPAGRIVNSLPYPAGYGGIIFRPGSSECARKLFALALDWVRDEGCVAATFCTPPLGTGLDWYSSVKQPAAVLENFFQYQSLETHPIAQLSAKRRSAFRNELRRAHSYGIRLSRQSEEDRFNEWYETIYLARCVRIGVDPIDIHFFTGLLQSCSPWGADLVYAHLDGRLVSGTLFTYYNGILDYYATASLDEGLESFAPTLALNEVIAWSIETKACRWLNWQSSPSRASGVYAFKRRWGAVEGAHHYLSYRFGDTSPLLDRSNRRAYPGYFLWPASDRKD